MKKKRKVRNKSDVSLLKEKAWKEVSLYVRLSHANKDGFVKCFTCDNIKFWKEMQAGHFVPGRGNSILFDIRGIRPQCYGCNIMHAGRQLEFLGRLEQDMGKTEAIELKDELMKSANEPYKFKREELESIIEKFRTRNKVLLDFHDRN